VRVIFVAGQACTQLPVEQPLYFASRIAPHVARQPLASKTAASRLLAQAGGSGEPMARAHGENSPAKRQRELSLTSLVEA